jgi:hypothetical protein
MFRNSDKGDDLSLILTSPDLPLFIILSLGSINTGKSSSNFLNPFSTIPCSLCLNLDLFLLNVDDKLVEKETVPKTKSAKEFRLELEKNKKDKIKSKNSDAKKSDDNKKNKSKLRQSEHGIVEKGFKKFEDGK